MIHEITDENFESEVMDAGIPCVIEFTSDWCVLCKDMVPAFEKVAEELGDKVKFCSVDTGKQRKLGITFAVGSLPYVVYVANGEMTSSYRQTGCASACNSCSMAARSRRRAPSTSRIYTDSTYLYLQVLISPCSDTDMRRFRRFRLRASRPYSSSTSS